MYIECLVMAFIYWGFVLVSAFFCKGNSKSRPWNWTGKGAHRPGGSWVWFLASNFNYQIYLFWCTLCFVMAFVYWVLCWFLAIFWSFRMKSINIQTCVSGFISIMSFCRYRMPLRTKKDASKFSILQTGPTSGFDPTRVTQLSWHPRPVTLNNIMFRKALV